MLRRSLLILAACVLAASQWSCAVPDAADSIGPSVYAAPPQDAARIGLPAAYRVFYDELREEGSWTLIEPYGWCFRPHVNFVAWRPYQQGWWEPSDVYGWIWNSTEPFGWITYHYGNWFYDSYQGWVWQPGPVWGPSWVAWAEIDRFIGWAPLAPDDYNDFSRVPGGVFTYAGVQQFAQPSTSTSALFVNHLPDTRSELRGIENLAETQGVPFNRGPDFFTLQRLGAIVPARVEDDRFQRVDLHGDMPVLTRPQLLEKSRRMVAQAARELSALRNDGVIPPAVPPGPPPTPISEPRRKPRATPVQTDSVRTKPAHAPADSTAEPVRKPRRRPAPPDSSRG